MGKSNSPVTRIQQHHSSGYASAWTNRYQPVSLIELIGDCEDEDEDKYTIKYMKAHGIDNVRGGSFCQIQLDDSSRQVLETMMKTSENACYKCGNTGHYARYCRNGAVNNARVAARASIQHRVQERIQDFEFEDESEEDESDQFEYSTCFRCGRRGHFANTCYARTHSNGRFL